MPMVWPWDPCEPARDSILMDMLLVLRVLPSTTDLQGPKGHK